MQTDALSKPIYAEAVPASVRAWVEVDLDAVRRNADKLRERARVPIVAMVKADGYGTGMLAVARALGAQFADEPPSEAEPAWAFGVATLDEAGVLRESECSSRVLCTSPLSIPDLGYAHELDVTPSLHRAEDILAWRAIGGRAWHLAIDTGMSRAGVRWDEVVPLKQALHEHPPEGVFTHFHSAEVDDGSREQQESRFNEALATLNGALLSNVLIHSDNTAGIAARTAGSPGQLARPGIGLYGASMTEALGLEQTVHLRARIIDVRDVREGESVSYGATWRASGTRRVATVAAGYADGYRRTLSNRGVALVRGQRVPVAGTVTMDMTMLDVTGIDGCDVGTVVTLIGRDGTECVSTDDVAALAGLSPYEVLVGLRLRLPRSYRHAAGNFFDDRMYG
jgi:alanine racemase